MLRWYDGFEQYGLKARMLEGVGGAAAWSQVDADWDLSQVNPATGAWHMRMQGSTGGDTRPLRRALGQSKQISGFGYRVSTSALPSNESSDPLDSQMCMLEFRDVTNTRQCRINLGTEGSVRALRGTTELRRSDPCIAAGGYHHFEATAKIDNSAGYLEVRVNEITVINLTGIDTQQTANAETSQFVVGELGDVLDPGIGGIVYDIDDPFAWDDDASDPDNPIVDFIGDKGAYFLKTIADTATSEFLLSGSATAYGALDEVPPDGVEFIYDTSGVARTILEVEDLPGNVAEVIAWMPVIRPRKEDSGTVELRGGLVVGSSESYGATQSPSTIYAYLQPNPKAIDPDSGVAWDNTTKPYLLIERTA